MTKEQAMQAMENKRKRENRDTKRKINCIQCGQFVESSLYQYKYMTAGGVLHGPFCSMSCYYEELL